jgi:4-amino-4-deoxy-L-arabinose transferase-like glycosyltransferase
VAAFLVAVGAWFVPMMIATSAGGELQSYRGDILLRQTVTRYAQPWLHHEPLWYYFTIVIPVFWLPTVALLPWLWPRWRTALGARDTWVAVLLCWVAIVLVFFSVSPGKRGVYVLPALPALVMAAAPWLPELLRSRGTRRLAFGLAAVLVALMAGGAVYFAVDASAAERVARLYGLRPVLPLAAIAALGLLVLAVMRLRDAWLAYAGVMVGALAVIGFLAAPQMDGERSGRDFMRSVERASSGFAELGLVGAKEQYLLQLRRPSVNFGQPRRREPGAEMADAAAWLVARPARALLVDRAVREACFAAASAADLGRANRKQWFLVWGAADEACVQRGNRDRARLYLPPDVSLDTSS